MDMSKLYWLFVAVLLSFPLSLFPQSRWYVSVAGNGTMTGDSWQNASPDLQSVVDNAQMNDTIWVASGTYVGGFLMKEGVQVFGGFAGHEIALHERCLPGSGMNLTILDGCNSFRVLEQEASFEIPTVWDGFVLRNGVASEGAGAYLNENGILRRCIIHANQGFPGVGEYDDSQGGVVLSVDLRTHRARVLAGDDYGANYAIGVEGRRPKNEFADAVVDMDGAFNSEALQDARAYQVLYNSSTNAGEWYLPSAGEWALLLCDSSLNKASLLFEKVNKALLKEGKSPLNGRYWSSTMAQQNGMPSAWCADFDTQDMYPLNVWQYTKVRGMKSYTFGNDTGRGGAVFALSGSKIEGCLIYDNLSALGYAVCARGDVDIVSSTLVANYSMSRKITSSVIDGGSGVHVHNTIVVNNSSLIGSDANFNPILDYQYAAVETETELSAPGNIKLLDGKSEFVDADNGNYVLRADAAGAWTGNTELLPPDLDTDLAGKPRVSLDGRTSIGAFEPSAMTLEEAPVLTQINVYPIVLCKGEWVHIDLESPLTADDRSLQIELFDALGVRYVVQEAQCTNVIKMPSSAGIYLLRVSDGNRLRADYKLIVK